MKRKRQSKGPYVGVPKAIMATPAWRAMSPEGRLLWIELRGWLRNDGLNNGKVHRACRKAAEAIGLHKDTIAHRFVELEHFGFLRKTAEGFLGSDGRGIAAKYRFTDLAHGTHAATRDYEKWDRSPFVYTPRRPGRKKQKPVLPRRTPRPTAQDIRKAGNGGAVCPTAQDIGEPPRRPTAQDISRLPVLTAAVGQDQDQGSSTARAPAQAGGAGSSPAPDAKKPWSTPIVIEVPIESLPTELRMPLPPSPPPPQGTAMPEAPSAPPAMTYQEQIEAIMKRSREQVEAIMKQPMLPGDRKRALQAVHNQEAVARDNAAMRERLH